MTNKLDEARKQANEIASTDDRMNVTETVSSKGGITIRVVQDLGATKSVVFKSYIKKEDQ